MRSYCIPVLAPDPGDRACVAERDARPDDRARRRDRLRRGLARVGAELPAPSKILINPAIYPPAAVKDQLSSRPSPRRRRRPAPTVWDAVKP